MPATKKKTAPAKTASITKKATHAHSAVSQAKPATAPTPEKVNNLHPFPAPVAHTALSVLQHIVEATNGPEGFTYMPTAALELLHTDAIEVNEGLRNSQNHVAVRATKAGAKLLAEMLPPAQPEQPNPFAQPFSNATAELKINPPIMPALPVTSKGIAIETDVPLPANIDSASRSRYPFDSLQVGHSFFLANTPEVPSQRKRMASTVANANKKYREAGIRFVVRDGIHPALGAGARVHRVS